MRHLSKIRGKPSRPGDEVTFRMSMVLKYIVLKLAILGLATTSKGGKMPSSIVPMLTKWEFRRLALCPSSITIVPSGSQRGAIPVLYVRHEFMCL